MYMSHPVIATQGAACGCLPALLCMMFQGLGRTRCCAAVPGPGAHRRVPQQLAVCAGGRSLGGSPARGTGGTATRGGHTGA